MQTLRHLSTDEKQLATTGLRIQVSVTMSTLQIMIYTELCFFFFFFSYMEQKEKKKAFRPNNYPYVICIFIGNFPFKTKCK